MPAEQVILDAGPLVAYLAADDEFHAWAKERLAGCALPLLTCESVLSEAFFSICGRTGPAWLESWK